MNRVEVYAIGELRILVYRILDAAIKIAQFLKKANIRTCFESSF